MTANSVALPTTLYNANGRSAHVGRNGADIDFIYTSGSNAESLTLDLTVGGTTTRFTGAAFGTFEDGGREIATREQMGDLLVTRKVYAPRQYFTRYLETFTNTSSAPVTVGATIVSRVYQEGASGRRLSSSGDSEFTTADVFVVEVPRERDEWGARSAPVVLYWDEVSPASGAHQRS